MWRERLFVTPAQNSIWDICKNPLIPPPMCGLRQQEPFYIFWHFILPPFGLACCLFCYKWCYCKVLLPVATAGLFLLCSCCLSAHRILRVYFTLSYLVFFLGISAWYTALVKTSPLFKRWDKVSLIEWEEENYWNNCRRLEPVTPEYFMANKDGVGFGHI